MPYGFKVKFIVNDIIAIEKNITYVIDGEYSYITDGKSYLTLDIIKALFNNDLDEIKPYLFPLSSMTEEQWIDTPYANLNKFTFDSFKCGCSTLAFETYEVNLSYVVEFINWCYKNHFDIHGLIPMGLAIDATGLNIY
jgi:hypothetical protein